MEGLEEAERRWRRSSGGGEGGGGEGGGEGGGGEAEEEEAATEAVAHVGHHMSMLGDRAILVEAQVVCAMSKSKREPQALVHVASNVSWLRYDAAARRVVEREESILVFRDGVVSNKLNGCRDVVVHAELVKLV